MTRTIIPDDPRTASTRLRELLAAAAAAAGGGLDLPEPAFTALAGALGVSPYLTGLAARDPVRLAALLASVPEQRIAALVAAAAEPAATEAELMRRLRLVKQEAALLVGLADLTRVWGPDEAARALSEVAEACLRAAVGFLLGAEAALGRLTPADASTPSADSGFVVLALGKLGAFELNYSSDVDLVVLFEPRPDRIAEVGDATSLYVRLTKRLVKILSERTPDGYAFRVDLRLRPDPASTPIAVPIPAALVYYESLGQNWERAALIKARPVAGDIAAGERFLAELRPFIWRKHLDYAAIADIHSIKRQIRSHRGHGEVAVAGHNVKLGRGGIREIEFFVQTQQLIAGGREPELRRRGTLNALSALAAKGWIGPVVRDELSETYRFLRDVEHRVQMVADEQTHSLPEDAAGLDRIGRMMGFDGAEAFAAALRARLETVTRHDARLFAEAPALASRAGRLVFTGDDEDPGTLETLGRLGYARPRDVSAAVRAWHFGRIAATRSAAAREKLTELVPALLEAFAATENADAAFTGFDHLVRQLPAGLQLFSIMAANPGVIDLLATIMGAAPRLARTITRRPHVLDAVLDPAFFGELPGRQELASRLQARLAEAASYEDLLDRARIVGQEQMFLIGVRVLTGSVGPGRAGEAFAALAEVILDALLAAVSDELARTHGRVPGGTAAVIAMGKLGGREMTAASDLDLILVYDHHPAAEASDGPRPLAPGAYYARLTQRLIAALSAPTAQGTLYAVDFRLRPSGNKGPVATSFERFRSYQENEAWTWERMALTRARVVAGDLALGARIEAAIASALTRPRDREQIRADVLDMRRTLATEKPARSNWDLKQAPGGLIDCEFIAQYLMLAHAPEDSSVLSTNTEAALRRAAERGFLGAADAEVVVPAVRLLQALTQTLRLATEGDFDPHTAPAGLAALVARAGEAPDLRTLDAHLAEAQGEVRAAFERIVGVV